MANLRLRTGALPGRIESVTTGAGIHRGCGEEFRRKNISAARSRNRNSLRLHRSPQRLQTLSGKFRRLIQKEHAPRTGSSCLCQTVRQLHIALLWGLTPVLNTPTPGVAVMGYNHPTKKGTPENYSILLGFLFIFTIIITSFGFFNWWGQSEQNILQ